MSILLSLAAAPSDLLLEIAAHLDCRRDVFNFCLTVSDGVYPASLSLTFLAVEQPILCNSFIRPLRFSHPLFCRTMLHYSEDAHKSTGNRKACTGTHRQA